MLVGTAYNTGLLVNFFTMVIVPLLFLSSLILLGYHVSLDELFIREKFFWITLRTTQTKNVKSVVADRRPFLYVLPTSLFQLTLWRITRRPYLRGDFKYKYFPFFYPNPKLISRIKELNPGVKIDPYLFSLLPRELREKLNIDLSLTDKASNILGYILYTILFLIVTPIVLLLIWSFFNSS